VRSGGGGDFTAGASARRVATDSKCRRPAEYRGDILESVADDSRGAFAGRSGIAPYRAGTSPRGVGRGFQPRRTEAGGEMRRKKEE